MRTRAPLLAPEDRSRGTRGERPHRHGVGVLLIHGNQNFTLWLFPEQSPLVIDKWGLDSTLTRSRIHSRGKCLGHGSILAPGSGAEWGRRGEWLMLLRKAILCLQQQTRSLFSKS